MQFRTEAFNLPNHPVFDRPTHNNLAYTTTGSATSPVNQNNSFGRITGLAPGYPMRQVQFALKLIF